MIDVFLVVCCFFVGGEGDWIEVLVFGDFEEYGIGVVV